jgi:CRISPR-associated endonuclease Cas1
LQIKAQKTGTGLNLAVRLIRDKIDSCKQTLRAVSSPKSRGTIRKLDASIELLQEPVKTKEDLLLIEARAAADYFTAWYTIPIKWREGERYPIPNDWRFVGKRGSFLSGLNRHATDPVNAMLNYSYAVLESQVLIQTVASGLDPTIGYLHSCRPSGRKALVYDLMEPLRPQVDQFVLRLILSGTFTTKDFLLGTNGLCRINPQLVMRLSEFSLDNQIIQNVIEYTRTYIKG